MTLDSLEHCRICPRKCGVNRLEGKLGWCKAGALPKVARAALHYWEEPCISGSIGSGTVFFSHCNLGCVFCQNHSISWGGYGQEVSCDRLADIILEIGSKAANVNLVSATQYAVQVAQALDAAKRRGLSVPVVYNTNGYENVETIRMLDGLVDVYLPDLKYFSDELAVRYSSAPHYFDVATLAIKEMYRQVGDIELGPDGLARRGLLVRHLVLPGHVDDSCDILVWIRTHLGRDVWVSLMSQYFPTHRAWQYPEINGPLRSDEYCRVVDAFYSLGLSNGYVQDEGFQDGSEKREECYVPAFDLTGVEVRGTED